MSPFQIICVAALIAVAVVIIFFAATGNLR